jgi:nicotinamide-nucleotide amidase
MKAEIINIGDELLIGQVVNTNASWMAEQLTLAGIEVSRIIAISDNKKEIINAIDKALEYASIVLLTGGLGPTKDDITKEALCEYFKTSLVFNDEVYNQVKELFEMYGYKVSSINRKQAEIPKNCIPLQNKNGTAPGMWFDINNKIIVSMPGVPFEMKDLIINQVIPKLHKKFQFDSIINKTILTQGIGESHLAEIIADWENELPQNFNLAYLPQPGIVRLRLSAKAKERNTLEDIFNNQLDKLTSLIPDLIFGYDEDRLEIIIGNLLIRNGKTLSTAESCSGGYIAHLITDIAGSSNYFKGSVVAYSNEIKEKILNVKKKTLAQHGAVSEEVVKEMALGIQSLYETDYAIATSGIAGPSGGNKEKPVGTTWIAIALPNKTVIAKEYLFGKHRGRNVRKTALTALNSLRKVLLNT